MLQTRTEEAEILKLRGIIVLFLAPIDRDGFNRVEVDQLD